MICILLQHFMIMYHVKFTNITQHFCEVSIFTYIGLLIRPLFISSFSSHSQHKVGMRARSQHLCHLLPNSTCLCCRSYRVLDTEVVGSDRQERTDERDAGIGTRIRESEVERGGLGHKSEDGGVGGCRAELFTLVRYLY